MVQSCIHVLPLYVHYMMYEVPYCCLYYW